MSSSEALRFMSAIAFAKRFCASAVSAPGSATPCAALRAVSASDLSASSRFAISEASSLWRSASDFSASPTWSSVALNALAASCASTIPRRVAEFAALSSASDLMRSAPALPMSSSPLPAPAAAPAAAPSGPYFAPMAVPAAAPMAMPPTALEAKPSAL